MILETKTRSVHGQALVCILCDSLQDKIRLTRQLMSDWRKGLFATSDDVAAKEIAQVGRPERPRLVHPGQVARRNFSSAKGHAAFIHAVAHIEFNAINLALDSVYRFQGMPEDFYSDWLKVAEEECLHFELLNEYLLELGFKYGDFDGHDGLWQMAIQTADNQVARMALVPRVLEARGLDVTPGMIEKLEFHGYHRAAELLGIIYRDEIGHVAIGTRWFNYCCQLNDLDPEETFKKYIDQVASEKIRPPLNILARQEAGFSHFEIAYLEELLERYH